MTEDVKPKKPPRCDRITLDKESLAKVSKWHSELTAFLKYAKISKSDLVSWYISECDDSLSHEDLKKLEAKFFDPVRALQWATEQAKLAKEQGRDFDLTEFVKQTLPSKKTDRKPTSKKPKTKPLPLEVIPQ